MDADVFHRREATTTVGRHAAGLIEYEQSQVGDRAPIRTQRRWRPRVPHYGVDPDLAALRGARYLGCVGAGVARRLSTGTPGSQPAGLQTYRVREVMKSWAENVRVARGSGIRNGFRLGRNNPRSVELWPSSQTTACRLIAN
jgi:hypothetical protein